MEPSGIQTDYLLLLLFFSLSSPSLLLLLILFLFLLLFLPFLRLKGVWKASLISCSTSISISISKGRPDSDTVEPHSRPSTPNLIAVTSD